MTVNAVSWSDAAIPVNCVRSKLLIPNARAAISAAITGASTPLPELVNVGPLKYDVHNVVKSRV